MKRIFLSSALSGCLMIGFIFLLYPDSVYAKSIIKDQVNIRSGPSLKSSISFLAPLGYPIEIEKIQGEWVYFQDWENNRGWVYKPLVSDVKTAVVLVKNANLRSAAGKGSKVIAMAKRGEIYKVLGKKDDWVRLGYYYGDDPAGWVHSDLVFGE